MDRGEEEHSAAEVICGEVGGVKEFARVEMELIRGGADGLDITDGDGLNNFARVEGNVAGFELVVRGWNNFGLGPAFVVEIDCGPLLGSPGSGPGVELFFPALHAGDAG